ncbi:hypothetical protein [Aliiglaciecola lipolytica]|uniref:hypothetical protein n=1 Tax=Aliiglaciecola lipolytica TaxID=477689 RepID=UPI001C09B2FF|nr:hypothetical protein [Aliiglaciecola lipolytica]MBU2880314.1 hypothetical protein [Aliiglaciecola lipolytica]
MKKKIVFVICNGRSGSTVFSKFLGAHSNCFALSEPHYFDTHYNDNELCSCEKPYTECEFWNTVVADLHLSEVNIQNFNTSLVPFVESRDSKFKKITKYLNLFLFFKCGVPYFFHDYINQIDNEVRLLESVMNIRNERVFIDASKSLSRAIFIMSRLKKRYEYSFVFLERDIKDVVASMTKDKVKIELSTGSVKEVSTYKGISESQAASQIKKVTRNTNLVSKIFGIKGKPVVYKEFTNNPKQVFINLSDVHALDWEDSMMNLDSSEHHLLGGNYSRINAKSIRKSAEK